MMLGPMSFVICHLTAVLAAYPSCYSSICEKRPKHLNNLEVGCVISEPEREKDCADLKFDQMGLAPFGSSHLSLGAFQLSAYINDFGNYDGRATAFNLSISDIKFNRLITRYSDVTNGHRPVCRHIDILRPNNKTQDLQIYISCPFEEEDFEAMSYNLEYYVAGQHFEYSRKLVFTVPRHIAIDDNVIDVTTFVPFFYIDRSSSATLVLHIQPVPKKFNVTRYKIWQIDNETNNTISVELKHNDENEIQYNFTVPEGIYSFNVAALHPLCKQYACLNSTSPKIDTKKPTHWILMMIINVIWIPPVILCAMYYAYKLYVKNYLSKRLQHRPNCLLVYSPTHAAHVDVMQKLACYLRNCNINAMIDSLDIPTTENKDPGLWCNSAFGKADVIVVATSPRPSDSVVPVIYHNMDKHALRLLKENYPRRNKKYFAMQLPYCHHDDLPEEARLFKRFEIPQDLEELVKNIITVDRLLLYGVSNREFLGAINRASTDIQRDQSTELKVVDGTNGICHKVTTVETKISDGLPSLEPDQEAKRGGDCAKKNKAFEERLKSQNMKNDEYFGMNIDELDLLGGNGESQNFIDNTTKNNDDFSIDELDL